MGGCNALFGISDGNYVPDGASVDGATPDASGESVTDAPSDADAAPPVDATIPDADAPAPVDASGDDAAPQGDAGQDATDNADSTADVGVPCGSFVCAGVNGCCFSGTPPLQPEGCSTPMGCASIMAGSIAECDGPEDCDPGLVCCATAVPGANFKASCTEPGQCSGAVACHVGSAACACRTTAGPCLPFATCGGICP
jgi:hypothetical protein